MDRINKILYYVYNYKWLQERNGNPAMKIQRACNVLISLTFDLLSLPFFYARSLLRSLGITKPVHNLKARNDKQCFKVDDRVILSVFWKNIPIGCGPAICLFSHNKEVLKFDCFGPGKGHFHITTTHPWKWNNKGRETRLYFKEQQITDQIERSIFELDKNLHYYLQRHPDPRIRYHKINMRNYRETLDDAKMLMIKFSKEVAVITA
jgi:hypothetical protein